MTFTYTYRDSSGALKSAVCEAANRAACLAKLKGDGLVPIQVKEGGVLASNISDYSSRPQLLRGLLAGLAVVLLLGGAAWFLAVRSQTARPRSDTEGKINSNSVARTQSPVQSLQPSHSVKPSQPSQPSQPAIVYPTNEHSRIFKEKVISFSATTNADGRVAEQIVTADGKRHSNIYSIKKPVFESGTDEQLALALSTRPGDLPPPAPPVDASDERVFRESLKTPITISPDDPPNIKSLKEKVIQARKDMADMLAKGMTFKEVLAENRKLQDENYQIRANIVKELKEIIASGDMEEAHKYAVSMNVALEQMGITGVAVPEAKTESPTKGEILKNRRAKENTNEN